MIAGILALNTLSAFAQAGGTGFSSTDLKTGISNSLAVIMMFGFVLGIACVIYGGFAIRRLHAYTCSGRSRIFRRRFRSMRCSRARAQGGNEPEYPME